MELVEKFADVIVKRYIEAVGSSSSVYLLRDGVKTPYDQIAGDEADEESFTLF